MESAAVAEEEEVQSQASVLPTGSVPGTIQFAQSMATASVQVTGQGSQSAGRMVEVVEEEGAVGEVTKEEAKEEVVVEMEEEEETVPTQVPLCP